jgi:hypothetical protein
MAIAQRKRLPDVREYVKAGVKPHQLPGLLAEYSMDEYLNFCQRFRLWFPDNLEYYIRSTYGLMEYLKKHDRLDAEEKTYWLGRIVSYKRMLWRVRNGLDPY